LHAQRVGVNHRTVWVNDLHGYLVHDSRFSFLWTASHKSIIV
jgi:hypothetical protein